MMTIGILVIGSIVAVTMIVTHRQWVRRELSMLKVQISNDQITLKYEAQRTADELKRIANNAKGIASNALSSAQRAEDKVVKHVHSVNSQIDNVINSVKTSK